MRNKFLLLVFFSFVLLSAALIITDRGKDMGLSAQIQNTDWPQFQKDSQNTGRTTVSVPPDYQVAWAFADKDHIVKNFVSAPGKSITDGFGSGYTFNTIFSQQMQPVIGGGRAYFGDLEGHMYAVNALTGDLIWEFISGGPIFGSAVYTGSNLVFASLDGKIYGLDAGSGTKKWEYDTLSGESASKGGIIASPIMHNGVIYVGSRNGTFYAVDANNGTLKWSYKTRAYPYSTTNPFNNAPIVSAAAVSEDGQTVLFGAENMFFYALNTANGTEKWPPKKLIGQSFQYAWPVIKDGKVIVRTMSSLEGAEWVMEGVLDGLSSSATIAQETAAIQNWLGSNPYQKTMYVFDIATGEEPYQVAMGRVTGNNYTAHPPVVDNQGRVLTYWRSRVASFFPNAPCFGTNYCPDFSAMDTTTGLRVKLPNSQPQLLPELDNGFQPTVGGNYLYLTNHFRGTHAINLNTGALTRLTTQAAKFDGGDFRGWGFKIIYYGNDSEPSDTRNIGKPPSKHVGSQGFAGMAIASTGGTSMLYVNEQDAGFIVAIRQK